MSNDSNSTMIIGPGQSPQPPRPNQKAKLVILAGEPIGKIFHLDQSVHSIGRESTNSIFLQDDSASRHHAKFFQKNNLWYLEDLNSTNGTFVNFDRKNETQLSNGDLISVGKTVLKFINNDLLESEYHEEMFELSTTDGLTNIPNRKYFIDFLSKEISRCQRQNLHFSLFMADIDHFKKVNDTYGHPAGDFILKELVNIFQNNIRNEDLFARYGGEEFVGILTNAKLKTALKALDKIRKLIASHSVIWEDSTIHFTLSIGVTEFHHGDTVETIIQRADDNLYQSKNSGRNQVTAN